MGLDGRPSEQLLQFLFPYSYRRLKDPAKVRTAFLPRVPGARVEHGIGIRDGEHLRLEFESVKSDWAQGVHLEIDKSIEVDGKAYSKGVVVFFNARKPEVHLKCRTKEGMLWLWNVWDFRPDEVVEGPGSVASQTNFSGMLVEEIEGGYRYRCNEGRDDDDYDDLVFRIQRADFS